MGIYCIDTNSGMLEVSKGTYLTILKRKKTLEKTLTKRKIIFHEKKSTVKKLQNIGRIEKKQLRRRKLKFQDKNKGQHYFYTHLDKQVFQSKFPIPTIQMCMDNDQQSTWQDIQINTYHMTMSLQNASQDNHFSS